MYYCMAKERISRRSAKSSCLRAPAVLAENQPPEAKRRHDQAAMPRSIVLRAQNFLQEKG